MYIVPETEIASLIGRDASFEAVENVVRGDGQQRRL